MNVCFSLLFLITVLISDHTCVYSCLRTVRTRYASFLTRSLNLIVKHRDNYSDFNVEYFGYGVTYIYSCHVKRLTYPINRLEII